MKTTLRNSILAAVLLSVAACSTTRRIGEGEVLYVGVRRMEFVPDSGVKPLSAAVAAAKKPLSVAPNNPLFSPYLRTPLPTGLWAYNHLYTEREKGLRRWLYERLAKEPVLVSAVQPDLRARVAAEIMGDYGYFRSVGAAELHPRKGGRKAKVSYRISVAPPYSYSSVEYPAAGPRMQPLIDSLESTSPVTAGGQYSLPQLTAERTRVAQALRRDGYYFFRPDYLEFLADTTLVPRGVALRMRFLPATPQAALQRWRVGTVTLAVENLRGGTPDTILADGVRIISPHPLKIRRRVAERAVTLREGDLLNPDCQAQSLANLNKLGIFRSVEMTVAPPDSMHTEALPVTFTARENRPLTLSFEGDVTSKSNSFLGPGVSLAVSHGNLFRGGEVLGLTLNGSYEWQTGRNRGKRLNSYEAGLHVSLDIPRLVPASLMRRGRGNAATSFDLGIDIMNRPDYFSLVAFGGSASWSFASSAVSRHTFTPLDLSYNKLLSTSAGFDQTLIENPAIALSFQNRFIPAASYTYTFDRSRGEPVRSRLLFQTTTTSAGNLVSGVSHLFGGHEPQYLFGLRFSQFVKEEVDLRLFYRIGHRNSWLAMRFLAGAGYAYGNSRVMPYSEQFYIGGANSIRAFTVRSTGPGSYRPAADNRNGYLDQTGDFKMEANIEYRFGIAGRLNGAVFLDAGNIWLLRADPDREGAELRWRSLGRDIALGTGCGLRYDLGFLVLRLDLGIALHTPYPDPDRRGYYNIPSFGDGLALHLAIGYPF